MEFRRCFVSVDLPRVAINEIRRIQLLIKKKNLFIGKITKPENLHLTLKFLGEIDDDKVEKVKGRLRQIMFNGFECSFDKIGVFSKKFIRIVWVGLKGASSLQKEIDFKLEGLFEKENRFMGHVTMARVKHVPDKKEFISYLQGMKPRNINFKVDSFSLKSSELFPEGPVYKDLRKYDLS